MPTNPDRTNLCHFTFADGRRCTMPQFPDDMGLCYYHGEEYRESLKAREIGRDISHFFDTDVLTACDLTSALCSLFAATAQGHIKPKTATALAYLAQVIAQTQQVAKNEFLQSFPASWRKVVRKAPAFHPVAAQPAPAISLPVAAPCDAQTSEKDFNNSALDAPSIPSSETEPASDPAVSVPNRRHH